MGSRSHHWARGAVAALLASALGLPALHAAPPFRKIDAEGATFVQEASGTKFPPEIGNFVRTGIVEYQGNPDNVSAAYKPKGDGHLTLTVYSYRADRFQEQDEPRLSPEQLAKRGFESAIFAVKHYYSDAKQKSLEPYTLKVGDHEYRGWRVQFELPSGLIGQNKPMDSQLFVFEAGEWQLKLRASYAQGVPNVDMGIKTVLTGIGWPQTP